MAKNITLMGASYTDVPAVVLPQTGGGTASFTDVTDTTATASDVAQGKVFYAADGNQTVGTASGGSDEDFKALIERSGTTISLPDGLQKIGDYAFAEYNSLESLELPASVWSIGRYSFWQDSALKSITLDGVLEIGTNAFDGCSSLELDALPSGVRSIGDSAFRDCVKLQLSEIPANVKAIQSDAFYNCEAITVSELHEGVVMIDIGGFDGCTSLTSMTLPSTLNDIGQYAFRGCSSLESVYAKGAITSLSTSVFTGNTGKPSGLKIARFPYMAISTLRYTFGSTTSSNACTLLEYADIGNTAAIAAIAFANCYKLQTLILRKSDTICKLANVSAFNNTPIRGYNSLTGTIYVPSALISTYQTATNWSTIYAQGHVTFAAIEGSEYEL